MNNLATVYLHLDFNLSYDDLEVIREYLENIASRYSSIIYRQEINIRVELRDGSVKAWILIAGSIYMAIGQYGSFRSGVDQIIEDAKSVKKYTADTLLKDGVDEKRIIEVKRKSCLPDQIRRLFLRIDRFERRIADMPPEKRVREANLIARAAARISDELDYQEDLDQLLSCLDDRFKPSRERLELKHRMTIRKEEDFTDMVAFPYAGNELMTDPVQGLKTKSINGRFLLKSAPSALLRSK
ncbi:hypothetical protein [Kushneria sp. TE3]|uniref:hypothetical protein n=1 Tax=Kushneria sp. TE3 TaxID=3449832 RepID=UPI003F683994